MTALERKLAHALYRLITESDRGNYENSEPIAMAQGEAQDALKDAGIIWNNRISADDACVSE